MEYEEYMRNVLGYNQMPSSVYANTYDDYYYDSQYTRDRNGINNEVIEGTYPEIYRIVYPMVKKVCMQNSQRELSKALIENMTEEVFLNVETEENRSSAAKPTLKNGDVRNPNVREMDTRVETRQGNFYLRDLIKILILRELLNLNNRPRPWGPPPGPGMGRPPQMPYNQRPMLWR